MPPLTLESGLAWPLSGVALARKVHCGSIRGSLPKAPSVPPQSSLLPPGARDSGLKSCANSFGMTVPCDTLRVSESQRNGAVALHPQ